MQVKVTRAKYEVSWTHFVKNSTFKVGEDEKVSQKLLDLSGKPARKGRYGTVCYIRKGRSIVTGGVAIVHPKDKFDVETGRKLSLAQALQEVGTKAVRKLFWKKYFGQ